ncbi:MAG TPA: hypothetical protein VMQ65_04475 [Candidatus Limnocylindria bacterium]|nr:hypothetical protein [Candidatus Limnocylindria bacterium]
MDPTPRRFPIRVERRYRWILRIFGVTPRNSFVDLGETLEAHFGWSHVSAPVSNITRWSIEGPWLAITALGVRKSIRHGDLTFAGTPVGGVRVDFRERVPYWRFRLPALYVTVEDLEGFGRALAARGIPGEDRRQGSKAG